MTDPLHKWVATLVLIFSFAWGGLAYYVNTQIKMTELSLTTRIVTLEHQAEANTVTISEIMDLSDEINALRVELAKGQRHGNN